jgi:hypothetical protein
LRLRAEMKLPGRAWLQFEVTDVGAGSIVRQTAVFDPVGVFGLLYWYGLYPLHKLVFAGMFKGLAASIETTGRRNGLGTRRPGAIETARRNEVPALSSASRGQPSGLGN